MCRWVEAIKAYSEGLKRDPANHLIYSNRAQTYLKARAGGGGGGGEGKEGTTVGVRQPHTSRAPARQDASRAP